MSSHAVKCVDLSAGPVEYVDTGGDGPCLVLLHGVLMNAGVWDQVVDELEGDHRCVVPTLPLGAHRIPMKESADLSIDGLAGLVAELLDALALDDVTLVFNDWGGPQLLVEQGRSERVGRLALVACEAFDNFPPGTPGKALARIAGIPGGLAVQAFLLRSRAVRRATARPLVKRPVPDEQLREWFTPLRARGVRRDLAAYCTSVPIGSQRAWSAGLAQFSRPALVVWADEDTMMPRDHGRRLAELLPDGRLVEVHDSYTVVPLDQPHVLAEHLAAFVGAEHRGR